MGNSDDTNQTDTTEQEIDRFFAILGKLAGLQNTETKPTGRPSTKCTNSTRP
jgi:hypothetical protein